MARYIAGLVTNFDEKAPPNPMNGFLKEIIFTRYLGYDDIEHNNMWRDSSQCWICEKWDKANIQFYDPDMIQDQQFQKIFDLSLGFDYEWMAFKNSTDVFDRLKGRGKDSMLDDEDSESGKPFLGQEYLIKNKVFDRNILEVKNQGIDKVAITEL